MRKYFFAVVLLVLIAMFGSCANPVTDIGEEETFSNVGYMIVRAVWEDQPNAKAAISIEEEEVSQIEMAIGQNSQEISSFVFKREYPNDLWITRLDPGTYDVCEIKRDENGHKTGYGSKSFTICAGKNIRLKIIPGGEFIADVSWENIELSSDKMFVESDGVDFATLTAVVPATISSVRFSITNGSGMLSAESVVPVDGIAKVRVTSIESSVPQIITVEASADNIGSSSIDISTTVSSIVPSVSSVSNCGMRLINVDFNIPVDETIANKRMNYTFKNNGISVVEVLNAKLLSNKKTVQLFMSSGIYNDDITDTIEIKNVQDESRAVTMRATTMYFTVSDNLVPTVPCVEALDLETMRITFSEAVRGVSINSFRLDDTTVSGWVEYPFNGNYNIAMLHFYNRIPAGSHTIAIGSGNNIYDYCTTALGKDNPYKLQAAGYVLTIPVDASRSISKSIEIHRDDSVIH